MNRSILKDWRSIWKASSFKKIKFRYDCLVNDSRENTYSRNTNIKPSHWKIKIGKKEMWNRFYANQKDEGKNSFFSWKMKNSAYSWKIMIGWFDCSLNLSKKFGHQYRSNVN